MRKEGNKGGKDLYWKCRYSRKKHVGKKKKKHIGVRGNKGRGKGSIVCRCLCWVLPAGIMIRGRGVNIAAACRGIRTGMYKKKKTLLSVE